MNEPWQSGDHRGAEMRGVYRYALWRRALPSLFQPDADRLWTVFIMLNPSTADHLVNDQTISKCIAFADRWRRPSVLVANAFAWRDTDPMKLYAAAARGEDIVGPENNHWLERIAATPGAMVVCAWGNHGELQQRGDRVRRDLTERGVKLQCLGQNQNGTPKHPLYLAMNTELAAYV